MTRLKYICLSDLHCGAPSALLTDRGVLDAGMPPDPVAKSLRAGLSQALAATLDALGQVPGAEDAVERPTLVLLGDIVDLSLGTPESSVASFDALLQEMAAAGLPARLGQAVFLPGNHDHSLWTATRYARMAGPTPQSDCYDHTTAAFARAQDQPPAAVVDALLARNGFPGATTFYPNLGLISSDRRRVVVFHHGHFIEAMYRAMSVLVAEMSDGARVSLDAETMERLNSSWIDFVWSTDGDDGALGADIRYANHAALTGGQDIRAEHRLADVIAARLGDSLPLPHTAAARRLTDIAARAVVDSVAGRYGQMERFSYQSVLGADSVAGLKSYLEGTVLPQIAHECPDVVLSRKPGETGPVADLAFVFGHTHKPFETRVPVDGITRPPAVYNTGGWDVDLAMFGSRLGAAAVFVDDDLNVASLRLCDVPQQEHGGTGRVRVAVADGGIVGNPLAEALDAAVKGPCAEVWAGFSGAAAASYADKQAYIMSRFASADRSRQAAGGAG